MQTSDLLNLAWAIRVWRDRLPTTCPKAYAAAMRAMDHLHHAAHLDYALARRKRVVAASVTFTLAGIYSRKGV